MTTKHIGTLCSPDFPDFSVRAFTINCASALPVSSLKAGRNVCVPAIVPCNPRKMRVPPLPQNVSRAHNVNEPSVTGWLAAEADSASAEGRLACLSAIGHLIRRQEGAAPRFLCERQPSVCVCGWKAGVIWRQSTRACQRRQRTGCLSAFGRNTGARITRCGVGYPLQRTAENSTVRNDHSSNLNR